MSIERDRHFAGLLHSLLQADMDRAIERFAKPPRLETADLHNRIMDAARRNGCRPWLWPHNQGPFLGELLRLGSKLEKPSAWFAVGGDGALNFNWGSRS